MWKRRLSIFIMLAILAASIQQEPVPAKSAAPVQIFLPYIRNTIPVVISESRCAYSKYGTPLVRGNVMNIGDRTVYDVTIQAEFTDYNGRVVSGTGQTVFTPTVSMQRNPFEVGPGMIVDEIKDCTARIISWTKESSAEFFPLTVVYSDAQSSPVIVLFRNDQPVPLKDAVTYAWSLGQYYPFYASPLMDPIAPGETITYTTYIEWGRPPIYMLGMGSADP
jgi:hypothetical protein